MRSLFFGRRKIGRQPADYFLLSEEYGDRCESYGVEIALENGERERIRGVTLSQRRILLLLTLLMKNAVTPTTLRDVVEDWLLTDR